MKNALRSLALAAFAGTGLTVLSQLPYNVTVMGTVTGCTGNTFVNIVTLPGTQPSLDIDVPVLAPSCTFSVTLDMASQGGGFTVSTPCLGAIQSQVAQYQVPPASDSTVVSVTFNCSNGLVDCLGVTGGTALPGTPCTTFFGLPGTWSPSCVCEPDTANVDCEGVPNGPALPGTSCTDPLSGDTGTWSSDCVCITDTSTTSCQAGFWVFQAYEVDSLNPNGGGVPIPYELWVWNLSTGTGPFQFEWDFGDGTSSFDPYPTHVYGASGPYSLCLTMSDAASCTSIYCDSVSIDGDGFYEGMAPENEVRNGFTIRVLNQLPASVDEQAFNEPRLWPNPVTDALNLSFRSTVSGTVPMRIIDSNGRVARQESLAFARGANSISLNAIDLATGIYLLRIGNDTNTMNIRFIKH